MTDTDLGHRPSSGADASASADEIKNAARDAGDSAKAALTDVKAKLGERSGETVDAASTSAGDSLRQVADQLRQAGDNLGEDQGWARQAFSQGAQGLERVSGYLRDGRLNDFTSDLQTFARSNPAAFLAGSVAVGFLAARVAKTAAEHATQASSPAPTEPRSTTSSSLEEPRSFAPSSTEAGGAFSGGEF